MGPYQAGEVCASLSGSPGWGWMNVWVQAAAVTWLCEQDLLRAGDGSQPGSLCSNIYSVEE